MHEAETVSAISIILYGLLSLTSLYYWFRLRKNRNIDITKIESVKAQYIISKQQFARESKSFFFFVLFLSSLFDIPFYVGCLTDGGPHHECVWGGAWHTVVWSFHLLALFGYTLCLGIPLFLWSDVLNGRDGRIWKSAHSADATKKFLRASVFLYLLLEIASIVSLLLNGSDEYFGSNTYRHIFMVAEPALISCISIVWLSMGIRLQLYVRSVKFNKEAELRILFFVNLVMFSIVVSFLMRAVLLVLVNYHVLNLGGKTFPYLLWVLLTRWMPYIYCSFMLIYILQRSESSSGSKMKYQGTQQCADARMTRALLQHQEHSKVMSTGALLSSIMNFSSDIGTLPGRSSSSNPYGSDNGSGGGGRERVIVDMSDMSSTTSAPHSSDLGGWPITDYSSEGASDLPLLDQFDHSNLSYTANNQL